MTERSLRVPLPEDVERFTRWTAAAFRACELHDTLYDIVKIFNNIDIEAGCRSTVRYDGKDRPAGRSGPSPIVKKVVEKKLNGDFEHTPIKVCLEHV